MTSIQPLSFPGTRLPPPGTPAATGRRDQFIADMLGVMGDARSLWVPGIADTTTTTDVSRYAGVYTYDATIASRISALGSGVAVSFNGTDQTATVPDHADQSFGGTPDAAFSVFGLVKVTANAQPKIILSKYDYDTVGLATQWEWRFEIDASERVRLGLYDDSTGGERIGRYDATVLTAGQWYLLGGTYNGNGAASGIQCWTDAVQVDDTNDNSGTYVAMEDVSGKLRLGSLAATAAVSAFYYGSMACVGLTGRLLTTDDWWEMKKLVNGFHGLTL